MFGVDRSHVAQGRGDPAGKAKPYSGPTDPVGWLATAARHALSHHHPESFAPHVVFPPYLLVKVCGPKRAVAVATGAAAGRAAFAAAAARGLALSLCYVMHADWFNDVCDVDVDAKNKPERPLPSGACSRAQGLLVAAFYGCLGLGVTRTPPEPALRRAYAAAFAAMGAAAFLYSDDRLPTRRLARRAPLGRALAFCGIYAAFDALMYVEACDALGLAPAPFAANPLFGAFIWAAAATVPWNLALLVAKDLGDVPGDAAAGLRTLPAALPDDRSAGRLVLALPGPEWKYRVDLREPPRHAIEQTRSRGQRRVDGVEVRFYAPRRQRRALRSTLPAVQRRRCDEDALDEKPQCDDLRAPAPEAPGPGLAELPGRAAEKAGEEGPWGARNLISTQAGTSPRDRRRRTRRRRLRAGRGPRAPGPRARPGARAPARRPRARLLRGGRADPRPRRLAGEAIRVPGPLLAPPGRVPRAGILRAPRPPDGRLKFDFHTGPRGSSSAT